MRKPTPAKGSRSGEVAEVVAIAQDLLERSAPGVIVVELHAHAIEETGYEGGALRLLRQMYDWGYTHVSHSG